IAAESLNYLIGNPPFVGHQWRSKKQQVDMESVFPKGGKFGKLDFVAAWFYKAAVFAQNTPIGIALVSTNSITMGEQCAILWQPILEMGYHLNFAHRTFQWNNEAHGKAAVHCVIIGFSQVEQPTKVLFDYPDIKGEPIALEVGNINPYLIDAPNVLLPSRSKPPKGMPAMTKGSQPTDGGHLILSETERIELLQKHPGLLEFIKPFIGGRELINNEKRYCLWFADASPRQLAEVIKMPEIKARIEGVKQARLKSPTASVQQMAEQPFVFTQNRQPKSTFIAVPEVSSERRKYVPMAFLDANTVPSNKIYMIPDVGLYEFGILTSQMHMDWMRTVAGRLKSDYSYSPNVYQLFPWPTVTPEQTAQIEKLAQAILDAREVEFAKDP
ncbi:MAG: class I SAM-dependent DNA methyltransferase, partial [Thiotrichales bacterium]|nr:class I SAM-dependent DNA methyltransferase [Thiotrichales bacterium]